MLSAIGGIFGAIGGFFGDLFGFKKNQGETLQKAIKLLETSSLSEAEREKAISAVLVAEASSESWITATWRPLVMLIFTALIVSFWFGYVPPNLNGDMSPILMELFTLLKLGIGGYIGGRSLEKIAKQFNIGNVLKKFIDKKLM